MKKQLISTLFTLCLASSAMADTQIISSDRSGQTSTISSNGKMARIDNSADPSYMLVNLENQQFRVVDPRRKEILDLSSQQASAPASPGKDIKVSLTKTGKGPKIAGYSTEKYNLKANGKTCATIFASKKVMQQKGISELFDAMNTMAQKSRKMMGGFSAMMDDCTLANMQSSEHFQTIGAPLRVIGENGQLENEVKSINTKAKTATDFYQSPQGFKLVNVQEQVNQTQQQMQESMPDMNKLMQQMQQDGSMPPEAMEQMKKMQEMFKQQFQQQ